MHDEVRALAYRLARSLDEREIEQASGAGSASEIYCPGGVLSDFVVDANGNFVPICDPAGTYPP